MPLGSNRGVLDARGTEANNLSGPQGFETRKDNTRHTDRHKISGKSTTITIAQSKTRDASWPSHTVRGRLQPRFFQSFHGAHLCFYSTTQPVVARSVAGSARYVAASPAAVTMGAFPAAHRGARAPCAGLA